MIYYRGNATSFATSLRSRTGESVDKIKGNYSVSFVLMERHYGLIHSSFLTFNSPPNCYNHSFRFTYSAPNRWSNWVYTPRYQERHGGCTDQFLITQEGQTPFIIHMNMLFVVCFLFVLISCSIQYCPSSRFSVWPRSTKFSAIDLFSLSNYSPLTIYLSI